MRKLAGYLGVAMVAASLSWWGATSRPGLLPAAPPALAGTPIEMTPEEQIAVGVYQNVNRSVVNITTRSIANDEFGFADVRDGSGSGSVLDRRGHILTNYHVVEGARQINVTMFDGSSHEARLVGGDPNN